MITLTDAQLRDIADQLDFGLKCYVHITTYEVAYFPDPLKHNSFDEEFWEDDIQKVNDNPKDYQEIEGMTSHDSFQVMERFADRVSTKDLKDRLHKALSRPKPFRHFNDVINDEDEHRQEWFAFKNEQILDWVKERLAWINERLQEETEEEQDEDEVTFLPNSMTKQAFALEWIAAWNSHDIDRIMSHYSNDIDFCSPIIVRLLNQPDGTITDKDELKHYFLKGLAAYPDLHFELHHILEGLNSLVLIYQSVNNTLSAEFMELDNEMKISCVRAHYKSLD
ncbi:MAG: UPF0158 family protein [Bacteroidota bacterium]